MWERRCDEQCYLIVFGSQSAPKRARWTHTLGLGFRVKTPLGGALAIDYGYLLNPPQFLIPQNLNTNAPYNAIFRLHRGQVQFRFTQTF